jgi:hypothetical protein
LIGGFPAPPARSLRGFRPFGPLRPPLPGPDDRAPLAGPARPRPSRPVRPPGPARTILPRSPDAFVPDGPAGGGVHGGCQGTPPEPGKTRKSSRSTPFWSPRASRRSQESIVSRSPPQARVQIIFRAIFWRLGATSLRPNRNSECGFGAFVVGVWRPPGPIGKLSWAELCFGRGSAPVRKHSEPFSQTYLSILNFPPQFNS